MYKGKNWAFVLWAIFMGLVGILWPPTGDLYRYTQDFYSYKDIKFDDFLFLLSFKFDYLLSLISYWLGHFDLNFDLTRFIYNFIGYLLLGNIYIKIIRKNSFLQTCKNRKILLVVFMTFSFSSFLFRFGLSTILFVYGTYKIVYEKKYIGYLFVFFSVLNHASFILLLLGLLIYQLGYFHFSKKMLSILVVLALFTDSNLIINSFYNLPLPIEIIDRYSAYFDGKWAGKYLDDKSWKYQLMQFLLNSFAYIYIILYIYYYNKGNSNAQRVTNMLLMLSLITLPFITIHRRFLSILSLLCKVYILDSYSNKIVEQKILRLILSLVIFSTLMGVYSQRNELSISDMKKLTYQSTFQILFHSYDDKWIDKNITSDGDIVKFRM